MKSKKILKGLSILFIILGISCKAPSKSEPIPSIGTLKATPDSTIITLTSLINGTEKSGAITISGFNENVKKEVKDLIDVIYTVKTITVTSVQATSKAVPSIEDVQKSIGDGSFILIPSDKNVFDEVVITFANAVSGQLPQQNAQKIADAIGQGNTATITLKVEASANASIEGKYTPSTFDIRFGIMVK